MDKEKKRRIRIAGTGFSVPERILTNQDLEKMVDTSDEWIVSRSGIKERRIVDETQASSDLGIEAGRLAIKNAGLKTKDIDAIIVATATPDTLFPSTACWIQKGLKIDHVPAFDMSAGCTGFIYGMILTESLILSGTFKRVLFIAAETLTRITNWKDRSTCVLFGDAAGAAVFEESPDDSGILSHYWKADGELGELLIQPGGGSRNPATAETVAQDMHYLQMRGNEVFKHAVKRMTEAALEALKKVGMTHEDVDYLLPHQANIRIIEATGKRLKLPRERVFSNIHKYGNVSAATIPVGLHEISEQKILKKGDILVMDAFGAGFTWGAVVYRW